MKEVLFIIGALFWFLWLIDTVHIGAKGTHILNPRYLAVIPFVAVTTVMVSWYLV